MSSESSTPATPSVQDILSGYFNNRRYLLMNQPAIRAEFDRLQDRIRATMPDNPAGYGFKVYSQTDEDGIIENILERLPDRTYTFFEIGCGSGWQNNTLYMLLKGYRGMWIDGHRRNIKRIQTQLGDALEGSDLLTVQKWFVTQENTADLIRTAQEVLGLEDPDFFSIDIDGNDLLIARKALECFRPKVICAEYNGLLGPSLDMSMPYTEDHGWRGDDYYGASLSALCREFDGYTLVSCNLAGSNAFFVRNDYSDLFTVYSKDQLYQPSRFDLQFLIAGHGSTMKFLRAVLEGRAGARASDDDR